MKKNRFFVFGLISLIFALTLAGCKENPKALAKQTYDLTQDVLANPLKMVGGLVKAANIKKKVDKLSPADKQIYNEELARLTGQGEGEPGILGGLLGGNSTAVGETLSALLGAIGNLNTSGAAPTAPAGETAVTSTGSGGKTEKSSTGGKTAEKNTSGDMTWTAIKDSPFGRGSINAIVYGNNKFLAGGGIAANGVVDFAYSTDGVTWTRVDVTSIFGIGYGLISIEVIAYGKDKFVAAGKKTIDDKVNIAYSTDGETWSLADVTSIFTGPGINLPSVETIAYGSNKFVAGGQKGRMAYSPDGVTWTAIENSSLDYIHAIAYGNNKFVATSYGGKIATSTDGITWTAAEDSILKKNGMEAIAYGSNKFVIVGSKGIAYSTNGETWTQTDVSGIFGLRSPSAIAYCKDRFIAGGSVGTMAYSTDGITWTAVTDSKFGTHSFNAFAYGNGTYVAVGAVGTMAYSKDR